MHAFNMTKARPIEMAFISDHLSALDKDNQYFCIFFGPFFDISMANMWQWLTIKCHESIFAQQRLANFLRFDLVAVVRLALEVTDISIDLQRLDCFLLVAKQMDTNDQKYADI